MDIIASHQAGLVDMLAQEAAALAGRAGDVVQRAIVYHHLHDHSSGRHGYALLCAQGVLALDGRLKRVDRAARRARWRLGRAAAAKLGERVDRFGETLRVIDRERCEAMLLAYRLALSPALRGAAAAHVPADLVEALAAGDRRSLFLAHQRWVEDRWGLAIEAAIADLAWPLRAASVAATIAPLRIGIDRFDAAEREGWARLARRAGSARTLPKGFAANPAQHYYALQRAVTERRRNPRSEWAEQDQGDAVRLAA